MNTLTTAHNPEGEAVVNDSPVGCQSRRTDRSIFSAEKMQDRWFKSFSRNQTNPQEWLNTAVFGDFLLPEKAVLIAFDPCLTHTGIFTENHQGIFDFTGVINDRIYVFLSYILFFKST